MDTTKKQYLQTTTCETTTTKIQNYTLYKTEPHTFNVIIKLHPN